MTEKTQGDVWNAIETLRKDQAVNTLTTQRTESALKEVLAELKKVTEAVGWTGTDERGAPIGTGIRGDLMRLEGRVNSRFSIYDGWKKYAAGALAAATAAVAILWWLLSDKLEGLLK